MKRSGKSRQPMELREIKFASFDFLTSRYFAALRLLLYSDINRKIYISHSPSLFHKVSFSFLFISVTLSRLEMSGERKGERWRNIRIVARLARQILDSRNIKAPTHSFSLFFLLDPISNIVLLLRSTIILP